MQTVLPDPPEPDGAAEAGLEIPAHTREALRGMSEEAIVSLSAAFAEEVAERLPHLRRVVHERDPDLLSQALRDAHTLATSAFVVGESEAGRLARQAEDLLQENGSDLSALPAVVEALDEALRGWQR